MSEFWSNLSMAAPDLLQTMLRMEVQFIAVALLVLLLDQRLKQWSPNLRYSLWLLVLAKALWPPMLSISAFDIWPRQLTLPMLTGATVPASPSISPVAAESGSIAPLGWVIMLWAVVSAALLLIFLWRHFTLQYRLADARWAGAAVQALTPAEHAEAPVLVSGSISSPLTFGLFRPRIYLTPQVAAGPSAELRAVLYHEWAHARRRDNWVSLLQLAALLLHPLNPATWLLSRRLNRYREEACDAFALDHAGLGAQAYGHILLGQATGRPAFLTAWQAGACFSDSQMEFKHRLTQLLKHEGKTMQRSSFKSRLLIGGILMVAVVISSQCQGVDDTQPVTGSLQEVLPPSEGPAAVFIPYDVPPKPIGGYGAILQATVYPEAAREAGIEGLVIVRAFVSAQGVAEEINVLKNESGNPDLAAAAIAAIQAVLFEPAQQKGEPVGVWIAFPVNFALPETPPEEK